LESAERPALDLNKLTLAWCALVFRVHPGILRVNGRPVLVADGIKVAKTGRKMPGAKKLHRQSESNTKPEYILGHSCQALAVPTQALSSVFALPLACRIHEGTVFSNRDHRTLLVKRVKSNSVAFFPATPTPSHRPRGRSLYSRGRSSPWVGPDRLLDFKDAGDGVLRLQPVGLKLVLPPIFLRQRLDPCLDG
jgi:hypothetical protein